MSAFNLFILAFAMSIDAFAVSIAKGFSLSKPPTLIYALRIGLLFGFIEGLTPLIGWGLGILAHQWIEQWDHWVAFFLLLGLGFKSIYEYFTQQHDHEEDKIIEVKKHQPFSTFILTAIGTSLDSMTIGISLAFLKVNILFAMLLIGLVTMFMVSLGILIGQSVGNKIKHVAELVGGLILISIGSFILYSHLTS